RKLEIMVRYAQLRDTPASHRIPADIFAAFEYALKEAWRRHPPHPTWLLLRNFVNLKMFDETILIYMRLWFENREDLIAGHQESMGRLRRKGPPAGLRMHVSMSDMEVLKLRMKPRDGAKAPFV